MRDRRLFPRGALLPLAAIFTFAQVAHEYRAAPAPAMCRAGEFVPSRFFCQAPWVFWLLTAATVVLVVAAALKLRSNAPFPAVAFCASLLTSAFVFALVPIAFVEAVR